MTKQAGIWIDQSRAIIIFLINGKHSIKEIDSNIETRVRFAGESKPIGRFGHQFLSSKEKQDQRKRNQKQEFLHKVVTLLDGVDEMVVLGPAEMKFDLKKQILADINKNNTVLRVETADSMTQNQLIATVKDYLLT